MRLSFAGLKTALLYQVRGPLGRDPLTLDDRRVRDACASFQAALVDCLVAKLLAGGTQPGRHAPSPSAAGWPAIAACASAWSAEAHADRDWRCTCRHHATAPTTRR
jgi:hypothetical protein